MDKNSNINWLTAVERNHTVLFIDYLIHGQAVDRIKKNTGFNFFFSNILKKGMRLAYDKNQISESRNIIRDLWIKNGISVFDEFAKRCEYSCNQCIEFTKNYREINFSTKTTDEIMSILKNYFNVMINHASFLQTMIVTQFELEEYMDHIILNKMKLKNIPNNRLDSIKSCLKILYKPTHEIENGLKILEIGNTIQQDDKIELFFLNKDVDDLLPLLPTMFPDIWNLIIDYKKNFSWMGRMYFDGDPISEYEIIERIKNILSINCYDKLRAINDKRKKEIENRTNLFKLFNNDKDIVAFSKIISSYLYLRTYRLDVFFISHENLQHLFDEICNRFSFSYRNLIYLRTDEIIDLLINNSNEKYKKISYERMNGYSVTVLDGKSFWKRDVKDNQFTAFKADKFNTNQVSGISTCPGFVKGKVKIILSEQDVINMSKGEILLTTMTMPSLMLAVEKAAAIVTDEGGMLCHAAIISREFDIPCIIATEYATKVFKNGEEVIVDANKGIIRRINK